LKSTAGGLLALLVAACTVAGPAFDPDAPPAPAPRPASSAAKAQSSGGALLPEQACFDVQHYDVTLRVDHQARRIDGSLGMEALALEDVKRFALHLDSRLEVTGVTVDQREARFRHADGLVRIAAPGGAIPSGSVFLVEVRYGGEPRSAPRPPWDGGFTWSTTPSGAPWIATSCQGEGADLWWPCKDHPSDKADSMDVRVTVLDETLVCASNGTLVADEVAGGERTFHWRVSSPISNYNVALNIAPYEVIRADCRSSGGATVPGAFWAIPEHSDQARAILPEFLEHLRVFEELCGPYPFRAEKYGIAETPHLGMEHQTIVAYGNRFRKDGSGYDWLHNHELAHEWWANLVTCRDWKDMWIHEGFATYMQALYLERTQGPEAYRTEMAAKGRALVNRRPVAPRETQDSKEIYFSPGGRFDNDIYFKGSWVLHTLRWVLGDEDFFEAFRRMAYPEPALERVTDGSQVRFSDTEEIRAIAERVAGRDLGWFFEVYLRRSELPELVVERGEHRLSLSWAVVDELPFPMPVPLRIDGEERRVEVGPEGTSVAVPARAAVEVDPDHRVLRAATPKIARARGRGERRVRSEP
jgi:aminopeptidase N